MPSPFDIRSDAPNLLRSEALNVSIKFDRTGPNTGRVSWNIPSPAAGCTAETQAYCGMIVTLDEIAPSSSRIPTHGTVYSSDPTADRQLFAGDMIGTSLVIGAFYQDKTTTFFDVTGIKPNTAYYVSGYPADCQNRYYVEGVHAFSLSYTTDGTAATPGYHIVGLGQTSGGSTPLYGQIPPTSQDPDGVKPTDLTGLVPGVHYTFKVQTGITVPPQGVMPAAGTCYPNSLQSYTVDINGTYAVTYAELVNEINRQFALQTANAQGANPPGTGSYYWNAEEQQLYLWNGTQLNPVTPLIVQDAQPNDIVDGVYWFDPVTKTLYHREAGAWVQVPIITYTTDPSVPLCDKSLWFDGTNVYIWNGTTWCLLSTTTQTIDPSLPFEPPCGAYWYNSETTLLQKWNDVLQMWTASTAILSALDPYALPVGAFWFQEGQNKLMQWNTPVPGWNQIATNLVRITEQTPTFPAPGIYWYNPSTEELFERNGTNTAWDQVEVITFPTDPTLQGSCDVWWDIVNDDLFVWDIVASAWVLVANFYQQTVDPVTPPEFSIGDIWYNPDTGTIGVWQGNCFDVTEVISYPVPPTTGLAPGAVWYNPTGVWSVWNGTGWDVFDPTDSAVDPSTLAAGTFWFDTGDSSLQMWNGVAWQSVVYTTVSPVPETGSLWFDTANYTLKQWDGTRWISATPNASVELNCRGYLVFTNHMLGSASSIAISDISLFQSLTVPKVWFTPTTGADGVSQNPSYEELGVGTDGGPAQRRELMQEILMDLGYPVVDVELKPEQLDYCISKALQEIRSRTGIAYKHGFKFMQVRSNTQRYLLTNKQLGYDRIVTVIGAYRITAAFLSATQGAGIYGQVILQQLYNMGNFDLLSYHLMSEYVELMEMLFASRITFTWDESSRELWMNQGFLYREPVVLLEVAVERTEQEIMSDRWVRPWIRKWASAEARLILAQERGKYASLPGASGSVTLNAAELRQEALDMKAECLLDIENSVVDKPEDYGVGTQLLIG